MYLSSAPTWRYCCCAIIVRAGQIHVLDTLDRLASPHADLVLQDANPRAFPSGPHDVEQNVSSIDDARILSFWLRIQIQTLHM